MVWDENAGCKLQTSGFRKSRDNKKGCRLQDLSLELQPELGPV